MKEFRCQVEILCVSVCDRQPEEQVKS